MPNEHSALIGLSKYARLVEWVMTRPQIQEEAITQLAELLQDKMQPDGLAIVMVADHYCMQWRGVKDMDSKMTNSIMRGSFRDPRHRDVALLDYAEIAERRFANWRMGSVNLNRVNLGSILRFSESPVLDPFSMSGPASLALLEELTSTAAIVSREGS